MNALRKLLVYVMAFIGICGVAYQVVVGLGESVSSQAQSSRIDGIGSLLGYVIGGLFKIIIIAICSIPGAIWAGLFKGNEGRALTIVACCAGGWLLLTVASNVNFHRLAEGIAKEIDALTQAIARTTARLTQRIYYNVMEVVLRPAPSHRPTNERSLQMPDPSEFINVEASDGNESKAFRATLLTFQKQAKNVLPDIPNLPTHSSEYEGWFAQTKKIIAMRKQTIAANHQLDLVKSFTNLYAEYHNLTEVLLKIQKNKNEMEKEKERSNLLQMQMEVERLELEARKAELEKKIAADKAEIERISKPGAADRLEQLKHDVQVAQLEAQLHTLHNPPGSSRPPTPVEQLEREVAGFKDLEAWKASWPAGESDSLKAIRLDIYKKRKARLKDKE